MHRPRRCRSLAASTSFAWVSHPYCASFSFPSRQYCSSSAKTPAIRPKAGLPAEHEHLQAPPKDVQHEDVISLFLEHNILQDPYLAKVCTEIHPKYFKPPNVFLTKQRPAKVPTEAELLETALSTYSYILALQLLLPRLTPGRNVLNVAFSDGLVTAILATLVSPHGHVSAITHEPHHISKVKDIFTNKLPMKIPTTGYSFYEVATPLDGLKEQAPYDAIHVSKAFKSISKKWVSQLRPGGLMTIPLLQSDGTQRLVLVEKGAGDSYQEHEVEEVPMRYEVAWVPKAE